MIDTNRLIVLLNEAPVGTLTLNRNDGCEFHLLESYKHAYPRPVLGQLFLDDLDQVYSSRVRVPPWFSNLLPEGPLRELVAKQAGVSSTREFFLLHHLGEDLPGAVRIIAEEPLFDLEETNVLTLEGIQENEQWHFSLAGVQLKFSANRSERGLTIPVSGRGGDWILKLPDPRYSKVPENEYATMLWAKDSGITIPELELINVSDISGLPSSLAIFKERLALAVRRFDRISAHQRVHMEDFVQILGLYPEKKYEKWNYETLARLILSLSGETGLVEFIRRLVFIIVSGNGDAHLKNWSLIYPDDIRAELSPAYDLVSIIQYKHDDSLALNLAKSKRWEDISMESFRRMARKIGYEEDSMVIRVQTAIDSIINSWDESGKDFGYASEARKKLERHFRRIPILKPRYIKS